MQRWVHIYWQASYGWPGNGYSRSSFRSRGAGQGRRDACWDVWGVISCWGLLTFWCLKPRWGQTRSLLNVYQGWLNLFLARRGYLVRWWVIYWSFQLILMHFRWVILIRWLVFVLGVFCVRGGGLIFVAFFGFLVFWIIMRSRCLCICVLFGGVAAGLRSRLGVRGNVWKRRPRFVWVGRAGRWVFWADLSLDFNL